MADRPTVTRRSAVSTETVSRRGQGPRRGVRGLMRLIRWLIALAVAAAVIHYMAPQLERLIRDAVMPLITGVEPQRQREARAPHATDAGEALAAAIARASTEEIRALLESMPGDALDRPVRGMTPLMRAARLGHLDVVRLLLERGADPDARGHFQRTALQYATEKNRAAVVVMLLDAGADIDGVDSTGLTPLIMAADRGYTGLALALIERGANVNIQHVEGWTALMDAAEAGDEVLVEALLAAGANTTARHRNGQTALDMARNLGHERVTALLERRKPGARMDAPSMIGPGPATRPPKKGNRS